MVIDEIGYLSYSNRHADLLFEIINRRYEQRSTVVTTNRPFAEWGEVFPNAACVVSLIDRLVHHSEIIAIEGDSYRMKEAKEQASKRDHHKEENQMSMKILKIPVYWTPEEAHTVLELLQGVTGRGLAACMVRTSGRCMSTIREEQRQQQVSGPDPSRGG
jgi:hypothetical protein